MPSKQLMGTWVLFDVFLLISGILSVTLSIVWRTPNLMLNMVFSNADLTGGMALGIALLATFVLSIGAIIQRNHITIGLVVLNWALILDALGIIVVGTFVWFYTLQERANFHGIYASQTAAARIAIQDKLQCCGYFNSTDLAEVGGAFCANQTFITVTNNATGNFCVGPITAYADQRLNDVFTTVYGFMAVVLCLFLASMCVIKRRQEEERFKRIDIKRGGRGFV